jgi:DNA-binding response OmpR family regulator
LGIIENDESLQQAYQQYFTLAGYSVHIIPYEEVAFTAHLAVLPKLDFILSDFRLGSKDGIYFITQLREEFNHDIPACIVTADTSPQHLELFSQHNIDVMYKPIDIKTIEKFISHHMP